jgi:predicted enzyme related to lactoylglutathione lyase
MGKRTSYAPGTFCWTDLATTDPEGAKAFYGELFAWEAEDMPAGEAGTYTMMSLDGDYVCGLYDMPGDQRERGVPPNWLSHISVESADAVAARAGELGGAVLAEPFDVLDAGRMALVQDPTGGLVAAWEPRSHIGAGRVNDPGCLTWNELQTPDPRKASAFYSSLFGWEAEPAEESGETVYVTIRNAGHANGGMMPVQQEGVPAHWLPYFTVESCESAVVKARESGGKVLAGPMNVGFGEIAVLTDPQGAAFALFEGEVDE